MKHLLRSTLLFLILIYGFTELSAQNTPKTTELDAYFSEALKTWNVPGMAVAIIKNDTIVLLRGYGVKEIGKPGKVDENTLFAIASNTKSFTATAMAMLVDEGRLKWDDKVVDYLPWFRLYDPYVTLNMTIRDLLTHRSGLETFSGDLIWYGSSYSRDEVIKRASLLKPHYGFRAAYGYSNIMYLAAGQIIASVSGMTWDEFIRLRILKPLEMIQTNTSITKLDLKGNTAMPHNDVDDHVISINYLNWDNIGPAGSINSSAAEMIKWIQFQLKKGQWDGRELVSDKSLRELWSPQTIQRVSTFSEKLWPSTHFKSYGMGWGLMDYHGKKVISHSGGYDGMISFSGFVPEAGLGFVILTNKNSSLYYPLSYKILDTYLSDEKTDWSSKFYELTEKNQKAEQKEKEEESLKRIPGTTPTLPLEKYAGSYVSEIYGEARIHIKDNQLYLNFIPTPMFHSPLVHWQYNTFSIKFPDVPSLPEGKAAFILDSSGGIDKMLIDVPNPDFDFTELEFIRQK
ncbi:MAG: serine hydrolase [Bacteroidales bacterium]|nr:serine hydrolase [Bacteroidales bacterium]